jgi:hypothetical protein
VSSTSQARSLNLDRVLEEKVDWRYKSFDDAYGVLDAVLTYF